MLIIYAIYLIIYLAARLYQGNSSEFEEIYTNGIVYNISCASGSQSLAGCSYNIMEEESSCSGFGGPVIIECSYSKFQLLHEHVLTTCVQ